MHVTTWERIFSAGSRCCRSRSPRSLISSLVWGANWLPIPLVVMLLGFDLYWAWRSINMGIHAVRGYRAMKATALHRLAAEVRRRDAAYGLAADRRAERDFLAWDDVRHLVIIPTYKESVEKLRATLGKLAESEVAHEKLLVVLAMEEPDDATRRARFEQSAARVRPQLPRDRRHDASRRHRRRSARQVIERGVGRQAGEGACSATRWASASTT